MRSDAPQTRVLVAGVSTRAVAESAARAGFAVTAIDGYADRDQHPSVCALSLPRDFGAPVTPHAAARAARTIQCDAVAYLSSFENHPGAVTMLANGRALWGNAPEVLRRVRDPIQVMHALRRRGLEALDVRVGQTGQIRQEGHGRRRGSACGPREEAGSPMRQPRWGAGSESSSVAARASGSLEPLLGAEAPSNSGGGGDPAASDKRGVPASISKGRQGVGRTEKRWLIKPLKSGGGHGVREWASRLGPHTRVPRGCYLQEFVDGIPGSIVFVAAGGRALPLGISRQLVGEQPFGADGYRYCGSILLAGGDIHFGDDAAFIDRTSALVHVVAEEFGLVGVNGIDFVVSHGLPYVTEVNPRWSASMELLERAYGLSVFGTHADACETGLLPQFDLEQSRYSAPALGKAIVFARSDIVVGDTAGWLADAGVRDVPHEGELIRTGAPVCTVFAAGQDICDCRAALVARAKGVYALLARWEHGTT